MILILLIQHIYDLIPEGTIALSLSLSLLFALLLHVCSFTLLNLQPTEVAKLVITHFVHLQ